MADTSWSDELTTSVRTLQIVVAAMSFGCVAFLAVVLIAGGNPPPSSTPVLSYIAAGFAALQVVVRLLAPGIIVAQGRKKILQETAAGAPMDAWPSKLTQLMMTKTIVAAAILEGAALFLLIACLVEKSPWVLAIAIALLVGIALNWPTQSSAQAWIDGQLRRLEEEQPLCG
jgi:hypothetical protein